LFCGFVAKSLSGVGVNPIVRLIQILCKPLKYGKIKKHILEVFSMQRKKTPEEIRKRELLKELIQLTGTKTASQAQDLVKEILSGTLETMLNSELEEELGYSKYDYKNKQTENSRNGYSKKNILTSNGEIELNIPRDRAGEYEPQIIEKHQTRLSGILKKR